MRRGVPLWRPQERDSAAVKFWCPNRPTHIRPRNASQRHTQTLQIDDDDAVEVSSVEDDDDGE
jgi:hypothetical protein